MSPTQRTLEWLRDNGYEAYVVEQTIRGRGIVFKRDLAGIGDILAWKSSGHVVMIQATSTSNVQARVAKAEKVDALKSWLSRSNSRIFAVVGWKKYAKPDHTGRRWRPTILQAYLSFDGTICFDHGRDV
jgi:hypothetical protein